MPRRSLLSATVNRARRYQAPVSQSYIYICIIYITYIGLRAQRTRCSRRLRCGPSLHLSRRARIRPSVPQTDTRWRWDVPFDLFSLPVAPLCRPSLFNAALSQPWQRNKSRFRPSHGESRAIPTGVFRRVTSCNPPPPPDPAPGRYKTPVGAPILVERLSHPTLAEPSSTRQGIFILEASLGWESELGTMATCREKKRSGQKVVGPAPEQRRPPSHVTAGREDIFGQGRGPDWPPAMGSHARAANQTPRIHRKPTV